MDASILNTRLELAWRYIEEYCPIFDDYEWEEAKTTGGFYSCPVLEEDFCLTDVADLIKYTIKISKVCDWKKRYTGTSLVLR